MRYLIIWGTNIIHLEKQIHITNYKVVPKTYLTIDKATDLGFFGNKVSYKYIMFYYVYNVGDEHVNTTETFWKSASNYNLTLDFFASIGMWDSTIFMFNQVAGLEYDLMNPDSPENTQLIEANHKAAYTVTTIDTFFSKVKYNEYVEDDNGNEDVIEKEAKYAELALSSSIQMDNLYVESIYTTDSDTASNGAMSMTCKVDGKTIVVRTVVLYKDKNNGILYTADDFLNKTITVKGIVDYFNGSYQIKVFSAKQIIVNE